MCGSDVLLGFLAILFPPLAVWVKRGICSVDSIINIALCCLGFLPGLLHAWYIIAITPDPTYEELPQQDPERQGGNIAYVYIQPGQPQYGQAQRGYGTVANAPNAQFPQPQQNGFVQPQSGPSSNETPPTYQQAVQGDNKVQRG